MYNSFFKYLIESSIYGKFAIVDIEFQVTKK